MYRFCFLDEVVQYFHFYAFFDNNDFASKVIGSICTDATLHDSNFPDIAVTLHQLISEMNTLEGQQDWGKHPRKLQKNDSSGTAM